MKQLIIYFLAVFAFIGAVGYFTRSNYDSKDPLNSILSIKPPKEVLVNGHTIPVEVVNSEVKRSKGLGGKKSLEEGNGMLFVFEGKDIKPPFWMKDMNFAIDIIWINDGKVAQITRDIPPPKESLSNADLKLYLPDSSIDYVLEVNAGYSREVGIKVGDMIDLSKAL